MGKFKKRKTAPKVPSHPPPPPLRSPTIESLPGSTAFVSKFSTPIPHQRSGSAQLQLNHLNLSNDLKSLDEDAPHQPPQLPAVSKSYIPPELADRVNSASSRTSPRKVTFKSSSRSNRSNSNRSSSSTTTTSTTSNGVVLMDDDDEKLGPLDPDDIENAVDSEVEVHEMSYTPSTQSSSTENSYIQRMKILNRRGSEPATDTEAESPNHPTTRLGHSRNSSDSAAVLNTAKGLKTRSPNNSQSTTENEEHKMSSASGPRSTSSNPSKPSNSRKRPPIKLELVIESHDPQRAQTGDLRKRSMSQPQSTVNALNTVPNGHSDYKMDDHHDAVRPVIISELHEFVTKKPTVQTVQYGPQQDSLQDLFDPLDLEESTPGTPGFFTLDKASDALRFNAANSARKANAPKLERPAIGGRSASPYAMAPQSARSTMPHLDREELAQSQMLNELMANLSDEEYEEQLMLGSNQLSGTIITSQRTDPSILLQKSISAVMSEDGIDYGHLVDAVNVMSSEDDLDEITTPRPRDGDDIKEFVEMEEVKESVSGGNVNGNDDGNEMNVFHDNVNDDDDIKIEKQDSDEENASDIKASSLAPSIKAGTSVTSDVWLEQMFTQIVDDLDETARSDS